MTSPEFTPSKVGYNCRTVVKSKKRVNLGLVRNRHRWQSRTGQEHGFLHQVGQLKERKKSLRWRGFFNVQGHLAIEMPVNFIFFVNHQINYFFYCLLMILKLQQYAYK